MVGDKAVWLLLWRREKKKVPKYVLKIMSLHISSLKTGVNIYFTQLNQQYSDKFLTGMPFTEDFDRCGSLRITYLLVPLFEGVRLQTLPWQWASEEIHKHVAKSFQVITPTLLWEQDTTPI